MDSEEQDGRPLMSSTQRWFMLALAAVPLVLGSLRSARPCLVWWTTHALAKVHPFDPIPGEPKKVVRIFAARNEFDPVQVVLRAEAQRITDVDVDASDLKGPNGTLISRDNVVTYFEEFVYLEKPSSIEGRPGEWPDPL